MTRAGTQRTEASVTITLSLPPKSQNPNNEKRSARFHIQKSREGAAYRTAALYSAMSVMNATYRWTTATIEAVFYLPDMRGLGADQDNRIASLKRAVDGICEAGIMVNDRGLTWLPVRHNVDAGHPRVELTITRTDPAGPRAGEVGRKALEGSMDGGKE